MKYLFDYGIIFIIYISLEKISLITKKLFFIYF